MSIQIICDKKYRLIKTGQYRLENDNLFQNTDSPIKIMSALMTLEEGTIIIVDKLNINQSHPDIFRGYIPTLDTYISAISFKDVI